MKEFSTSMEYSTSISHNVRPRNSLKIWVYSIRKNALTILFCLFSICLVLFSRTNLIAAKDGLILWATAVVPSLFPFFVATELLSHTNIVAFFGKLLTPIMRPLFNVPGEGAFAFLMGLISGYPVGAKIVSGFMEQGICTKEEAERMLAFTNNSGPLFIIGTVGITLFSNTSIGILLLVTHILACITVGIVLKYFSQKKAKKLSLEKKYNSFRKSNGNWKIENNFKNTDNLKDNSLLQSKNVNFSSLGEVLGKSITNSISTILMIGGFVVIFSVIISILNQSHLLNGLSNLLAPVFSFFHLPAEFGKPLLSGLVELTNGVALVAHVPIKTISINIVLCAFLLGFGGISVLLQVFSIISKSGLSIKTYFIRKLLQGLFAAFYTFLALQFIPFLQFNL